jgi:5-methyltetrahydropteroyltriglutamate--homocysteine methyltransferase
MLASKDRILTTHAGSLPRPPALARMFGQLSRREAVNQAELDSAIAKATQDAVAMQLACGIDIGNNGEQPRESFFTYVQHRMSGFGGRSERPRLADVWSYPTFLESIMQMLRERVQVDLLHAPKAIGEVRYVNRTPLDRECADYIAIVGAHHPGFAESFMTAPSPGIIAAAMLNEHYSTQGDYLNALAEALRVEYETIAAKGLILQIDAPDLAMEHHVSFAGRPMTEFIDFVDSVIGAINRALVNVPNDRVRLHVCWGNYEGPHDRDVGLEAILPSLLKCRAGALMLSMANPRHEHEYRVFERIPLPAPTLLIVGAIDTTTNYIEHPEVVADRLERAANVIGDPRRILAGTDCGFETSSGLAPVAVEIVWAKLRALRDGAAIAARRLFG